MHVEDALCFGTLNVAAFATQSMTFWLQSSAWEL